MDAEYCPMHDRICGCDIDWPSLNVTETVIHWLVSRSLSNPCTSADPRVKLAPEK